MALESTRFALEEPRYPPGWTLEIHPRIIPLNFVTFFIPQVPPVDIVSFFFAISRS